LIDSIYISSGTEVFGLEQLLHEQLQRREERYRAFRQHWYQLQARDIRRELLDSLNN
jgi:hypothetical protein